MSPRKITFRISARVASLFLLVTLALNSQPQLSHKQDQGDPVLGNRIAKGIVSDGRLWLRGIEVSRKGGAGGLVSLNLTDNSRTVHFQRDVVDIEKSGRDLWVLRKSSAELREYIVSVWKNGAFSDLAHFTSPDKDEPLVLLNIGASPAVLSRGTLRLLPGDQSDWRTDKTKG